MSNWNSVPSQTNQIRQHSNNLTETRRRLKKRWNPSKTGTKYQPVVSIIHLWKVPGSEIWNLLTYPHIQVISTYHILFVSSTSAQILDCRLLPRFLAAIERCWWQLSCVFPSTWDTIYGPYPGVNTDSLLFNEPQ